MARDTFDIETILDDIVAFLKSDLNTAITDLNTLKADSITVPPIADEAILFQTMNETIANVDPFVLVTVAGVNSQGIGPATKKSYLVQVIICKSDDGNDSDIGRKILRYGRILSDLFEKNWDKITKRVKADIRELEPVPFQLQNSGALYQVIGVELDFTIF